MSSWATLAIPIALFLIFLYFLYTLFLLWKVDQKPPPPPGPPQLPIIGNLQIILGTLPHRTLESLAKRYGPIMSLYLGQVPTIVISSSEAAELVLKTHDVVFAARPRTQAIECESYGFKGLTFSDYGPYWRHVRKLCSLKLFSASKVEYFAPLRGEELTLVVKSLEKASALRQAVDLSEVVRKLTDDIAFKMILGSGKDDAFDCKQIREGKSLIGAFNLVDYFPCRQPLDLQGLTRRFKKYKKALDEVLEKMLKEREQSQNVDKEHSQSFVDILLSLIHQPKDLQGEQELVIDRTNIKAIIVDIINGASTSSIVVEWALSELLRHPRVMTNVQDEIKNVVGMSRMVEEIDLSKFSYLDLVLKETLRLHPAGALIQRESREDIMIDGYHIKKRSRVLLNVWAIGRDPKVWSDNADKFCPERFLNNNIDIQGQHFQLIPFGSGRRRCPGIQMGLTVVKLIVAQLVHCFDWELPCGITPDNLDMSEKFGFTMRRAKHLIAIPTRRIYAQ